MKPGALLCCSFLFLMACISNPPVSRFDDPTMLAIANAQDTRSTDSLLSFLLSDRVVYRRAAALAFASVQDTNAASQLLQIVHHDDDDTTRLYAAFALGQMRWSAVADSLVLAYQLEKNAHVKAEILEAIGKSGSPLTVRWDSVDADVLKGLAWGWYRYSLTKPPHDSVILKMSRLLTPQYPETIKLGAANFFARGKITNIEVAWNGLRTLSKTDSSANVRMVAVAALGKSNQDSTLNLLHEVLVHDHDYRVRVNAARALGTKPYEKVKRSLYAALNDENINVAIATAEIIRSALTKDEWPELIETTRNHRDWRVQATLYEAILKASNDKEVAEEVRRLYQGSSRIYQKAALLTALGHTLISASFIVQEAETTDIPVIRSSAIGALATLNRHPDFPPMRREEFLKHYKEALTWDDLAVTGTIAEALMDTSLHYRELATNIDFLREAKARLTLPKDYEAFEVIERAVAYFEDREPVIPKQSYQHPIDWSVVRSLKKDQRAAINTTRGTIVVKLLTNEAPGSVCNFVQLVNNGYYKDKFFHRVVPNFVVQGGCNRGDGWGSEEYAIRSEFSYRRYTTGSMGMASAGKDTESSQWFITHSPTPHLDGRYTIFAEVVEGMEVVHQVEESDQIIDITLL